MVQPREPAVWSYDLIADFYATDMGQSMPFDDAAFYLELARQQPGPVFELGCGSGRILIELLAAGIDIAGGDRSLPMLQRLRTDAGLRKLTPRVALMDLRALALRGRFRLILAPYSLLTYLTNPAEVDRFIAQARGLLTLDGMLVLDAFVPRDVSPFDDFRDDYSRAFGSGRLVRAKRIARLADGCNRIERRYREHDATGALLREVHTDETIRPYTRADILEVIARHELRAHSEHFDYGNGHSENARFYTLSATLP